MNRLVPALLCAATLSLTGCNTAKTALTAGAGGVAGGIIGDKMSNGDPAAIIAGAALGSTVATVVSVELEKKRARDLARAFEEGRRYERELQIQNEWYKATLEPEDPDTFLMLTGAGKPTSRQIKSKLPPTTIGGMNLNERPTVERVLP
jgi:predicted small secreted protein